MARKRQVAIPVMPQAKPDIEPDHLAGHHIEDFLSPRSGRFDPITPMQAAARGPSEPEWMRDNEAWIREHYGEHELARREWHEQNEPGGKTFRKGKMIF